MHDRTAKVCIGALIKLAPGDDEETAGQRDFGDAETLD
jgi:hypothetical protein